MRINNKSQTKGLVLHDLREATLVWRMPKQTRKKREMKEAIFPQSRHKRAILLFNCQNNGGGIKMFHLVFLHHCLTYIKWHFCCKMIWTIFAFNSLNSQFFNSVARLIILNNQSCC